ncbi:MAG TPA: Maf family nucleotide pyrophosphatase [Burkholderiaceae bacterium]|jgi:septum formation protein|nr:Maf family nucleotide pyrophosphatase [Burkholderiaceae bacterium]
MARPPIVLASTSRYRRELLERLRFPFQVEAPDVDESAFPSETARETALRLARAKAAAVAARFPLAIVIGSDQTVDAGGGSFDKPMSHDAALRQLQLLQGRSAIFYTALAVIGPSPDSIQLDFVPTTVKFKSLAKEKLEAYLQADQPYDCAGAAKIESLGIALIDAVESTDPTALIGLPLIRLTSMLAAAGFDVLAQR